MHRNHLKGALLVAAATLLATGAYAQNPHASPDGKANAADKADKKAEKADKAADKADDKAKAADDRAARRAKEHDAERTKLMGVLKGPLDDATKQEIRRHAERLARLERIKSVAQDQKDTATVDKATTLIAKENDRHDKWMSTHAQTAPVAATAAGTAATPTPAADPKGGAK